MKNVVQAIILHLQKYSDKASILHTYTLQNGRLSFMVYGANSKRRKFSHYQPLTLVEIESTTSQTRDIPTLNNISLTNITNNISLDFSRRAIAIFISEIIFRTLRHPEADERLFNYIKNVILELDSTPQPENIHLKFLIDYTFYLGIMPQLDEYDKMLDITTGELINPYKRTNCFTVDETNILISLSANKEITIDRTTRQIILRKLCYYYQIHLEDFITPKSLDILMEVFN